MSKDKCSSIDMNTAGEMLLTLPDNCEVQITLGQSSKNGSPVCTVTIRSKEKSFYRGEFYPKWEVKTKAKTMPVAVCRAYKKWKEQEDGS